LFALCGRVAAAGVLECELIVLHRFVISNILEQSKCVV